MFSGLLEEFFAPQSVQALCLADDDESFVHSRLQELNVGGVVEEGSPSLGHLLSLAHRYDQSVEGATHELIEGRDLASEELLLKRIVNVRSIDH